MRAHFGFWAEAASPLAAELMGGAEDPSSNAVDVPDRSIKALPPGVQKISTRWDGGYLAAELAAVCVERGIGFAIGVKCNATVMAAVGGLGRYTWTPAVGMEDTESLLMTACQVPDPRTRTLPVSPGGPGSRSAASPPHGPASAARSPRTSSP